MQDPADAPRGCIMKKGTLCNSSNDAHNLERRKGMARMTSKERITKVLNHQQTDRTPIFEYVFHRNIPEALLGRTYYNFDAETDQQEWAEYVKEVGLETALRRYARDRLELCRILGHDMLYCIPNPADYPSYRAFPGKQDFDPDDPVESLKARNERRAFSIANNPINEDNYLVFDFLNEEMKKQGMEIDVFAPGYAHGASTDTELLLAMLMDDEVVREHYRLCTLDVKRSIDQMAKRGIRHIGVGGDFSGNRPIISPECYRKFIVPEVAETAAYVHSKGSWAVNASDGDLWSVIDDFLISTGVDAYMEIDSRAGMNLKRLKEGYGDRIAFYGNVDCGEVLSTYSPEKITQIAVQCLEDGMGNGGHIFTASNAITPTVPVGNYLAMVNAYRDYFGLAPVKAKI